MCLHNSALHQAATAGTFWNQAEYCKINQECYPKHIISFVCYIYLFRVVAQKGEAKYIKREADRTEYRERR